MKRVFVFALVFCVLFSGVVSAGWFDNFFDGITGNAVSVSSGPTEYYRINAAYLTLEREIYIFEGVDESV